MSGYITCFQSRCLPEEFSKQVFFFFLQHSTTFTLLRCSCPNLFKRAAGTRFKSWSWWREALNILFLYCFEFKHMSEKSLANYVLHSVPSFWRRGCKNLIFIRQCQLSNSWSVCADHSVVISTLLSYRHMDWKIKINQAGNSLLMHLP